MTAISAEPAPPPTRADDLLSVHGLDVHIHGTKLLCDVSLSLREGEVVGLVGESGSGKTLTGLSIMGLLPREAVSSGEVTFRGMPILGAPAERLRQLRGQAISMIFQDPRASLNPTQPVGRQIVDVLRAHGPMDRKDAADRTRDMLAQVGLPDPAGVFRSYTHELSGGMCQRVLIAMALICGPDLLIADEPTTALDLTIQAQIMSLLRRLADDRGLSVLLVSHDLGVVSQLCHRVVTMYCGEVVNIDTTSGLLHQPRHPYAAALVAASRGTEAWQGIAGTPANPANPPDGCRFRPRCAHADEGCLKHPALDEVKGVLSRCHYAKTLDLTGIAS